MPGPAAASPGGGPAVGGVGVGAPLAPGRGRPEGRGERWMPPPSLPLSARPGEVPARRGEGEAGVDSPAWIRRGRGIQAPRLLPCSSAGAGAAARSGAGGAGQVAAAAGRGGGRGRCGRGASLGGIEERPAAPLCRCPQPAAYIEAAFCQQLVLLAGRLVGWLVG